MRFGNQTLNDINISNVDLIESLRRIKICLNYENFISRVTMGSKSIAIIFILFIEFTLVSDEGP